MQSSSLNNRLPPIFTNSHRFDNGTAAFYFYYACCLVVATLFVTHFGTAKAQIDWIDLTGEFAAFLVVTSWIYLILAARPPGRVTTWLGVGTACLGVGFYLDFLDELLRFSPLPWGSFENVAVPMGVALMTYALILLHYEQIDLSPRHARRESQRRDHRAIDPTTTLYGAQYIAETLQQHIDRQDSLLLAMVHVDIPICRDPSNPSDPQSQIEHIHFLQTRVGEHLASICPEDAIVGRYAGEMYCVVLANHTHDQIFLQAQFAQIVAPALEHSLQQAIQLNLQSATAVKVKCSIREVCKNNPARDQLTQASKSLLEQA